MELSFIQRMSPNYCRRPYLIGGVVAGELGNFLSARRSCPAFFSVPTLRGVAPQPNKVTEPYPPIMAKCVRPMTQVWVFPILWTTHLVHFPL